MELLVVFFELLGGALHMVTNPNIPAAPSEGCTCIMDHVGQNKEGSNNNLHWCASAVNPYGVCRQPHAAL